MKKTKKKDKSEKTLVDKPSDKGKQKDEKSNDHGGIPEIDFKKLMGCG